MLKKGLKPYPFDEYGYLEVRVIDDTDFACEGDDPFATAHLLLTSKCDVRAITAANYMHRADSVEKSYQKILEMLSVMGLLLNAQEHERRIIGAPYINDDSTYTLRPDNPRTIAVYDSVDASFILEDLFAKLRYQYLTQS